MKELDWNELTGAERWDSWQRPHKVVDQTARLFTLFDTGEIVAETLWINAALRGRYNTVGITLCYANELPRVAEKLLTPDGTKVAKAHITQMADGSTSQQLLAIDFYKHEVYFCGRDNRGHLPSVPEEISKRATMYWPKYSDRPITHPLRLVTPRKLTKEQKQRKEECELLISAKAALIGIRGGRIDSNAREEIPRLVYDTDTPLIDIVAGMKDDVAVYLAPHGVPTKKTEYVPYLKF